MGKQCSQCKFNIPNDASVCGHCGSGQPYKVRDKSMQGRIAGFFQGLFVYGLLGAGCAWLFDFSYWDGILWGGGLASIFGFILGFESEHDPNR